MSRAPTQAGQRAAVTAILAMREKLLDGATIASLARSYGLEVIEVEAIAAELKREGRP